MGPIVALALVGCGPDYYYVGDMTVEGDTLVVRFLETCPATLSWDGTFEEYVANLSVEAHGEDCSGLFKTFFDLRPMKWAFLGRDPNAFGLVVRIPGFDADRGPDCAGYMFSPSHPDRPGSGGPQKCP